MDISATALVWSSVLQGHSLHLGIDSGCIQGYQKLVEH